MADEPVGAHILVVDDEPLNLDVLQQELEDRGHDIDLASDGVEALERVAASPPDLILLDVVMPRMDGIEVCRRLKDDDATAHIPIIIMTALSDVEDRIRGIEAGADDFLSKPVDDRELMARIATALRAKRSVDRTRRELEGATGRLRILESIDRDVSVIVARGIDAATAALPERIDGAVIGSTEAGIDGMAAVVIEPDPAAHAAIAIAEAERLAGLGARVGVAAGSGLVCSRTDPDPGGVGWLESISGPVLESATAAAMLAQPGNVVIGPEIARRLEGRIETSALVDTEARHLDRGIADIGAADRPLVMPWPDDFADLLEPLRDDWGVEGPIYLTRSLSGGKSGARVYAVDITSERYSGQAILKLDRSRDPTWDENAEAERHRRAYDAAGAYAEGHLPRIVGSYVQADRAAVLSTIAGRGLEFVVPWAQSPHEPQRTSARIISRDILSGWNVDHRLSPMVMPRELLDRWLGRRLDPERSRIVDLLDSLGIDHDEPTFLLEGHWYPNPFAFGRDVVELPSRLALRAATGRIHGDFHGFNVLLRSDADDGGYFVIDLAYYDDDTYLLFDNAYFELAYLLQTRETVAPARWQRLVATSLGHGDPDGDDLGLEQLVDAIRTGVREWIDDAEPNRLGYMESQYALARVAVGLNFVNKRVSDRMKLLALLYAASNLKAYLHLHAVEWPRSGPALAVDTRTV